jgi:hypothetical protein
VILMSGLQGAGKTTTTAKLGKWLKERQKKKGADGQLRRLSPRGHRAVEGRFGPGRHRFLSLVRRGRSRPTSPPPPWTTPNATTTT